MRKHFSEYFRPTGEESATIWAEAVFIFDTNVLLNLYRLSRETSSAFLDILKKLKGRLFLPHQVGVEFYKNREEEIAKQVNTFERVRRYLSDLPKRFTQEFPRHPFIPLGKIGEALKRLADKQIKIINECQKDNPLEYLVDHPDPILPELDSIFANYCEGRYTEVEDDNLSKKVEERFQNDLPPCCGSTGGKAVPRPNTNPHQGDGRVWFQIVKYAAASKKSIIFVTADKKANWWRTAKLGNDDRTLGPHFELIRDIESASGKRFMMYSQEEFHQEAEKYLGLPKQTEAIEELKQLQPEEDELKTYLSEEFQSETSEESLGTSGALQKDSAPIDQLKESPDEDSKEQPESLPDEEVD